MEKEDYESPELIELGSFEALTQGGSATGLLQQGPALRKIPSIDQNIDVGRGTLKIDAISVMLPDWPLEQDIFNPALPEKGSDIG